MKLSNFANASLPTGNNNKEIPEGAYIGTVDKALKKTSKAGNDYINFMIKLEDSAGKFVGNLWFMLFPDTDKAFLQSQAKAFFLALDFILDGDDTEYTSDDIISLAVGRQLCVCVTTEQQEGYSPKTVVNWNMMHGFETVDKWDMVNAVVNLGQSMDEFVDMSFMNIPEASTETEAEY